MKHGRCHQELEACGQRSAGYILADFLHVYEMPGVSSGSCADYFDAFLRLVMPLDGRDNYGGVMKFFLKYKAYYFKVFKSENYLSY